MIDRIATFIYGAICYLIFFGTFLYAAGFIGNLFVPKSIDSGPSGPLGEALLVNAGLLSLFAVMTTLYILVAIQLEERDLVGLHGDEYRRYQQRVPMILPVRLGTPTTEAPSTGRGAESA